jgi:hypothetical protein
LDRVIGRWLADQQPLQPATRPPPPTRSWRRAVAVDGKALPGSGRRGAAPVHLLAVMDHTNRAVLGQTDVDITSNEITQFRPLLDRLDLGPVSKSGWLLSWGDCPVRVMIADDQGCDLRSER